jgi:hypothetical protein
MARPSQAARERLQPTDIGGWLFRCNRRNVEVVANRIAPVESRCAVRSYRLELIRPGHPVVLWMTGPKQATPPPGVLMVGYATGEVRNDPADGRTRQAQVLLADMSPLPTPLPRARIAEHPVTASMEVLRQPFGPNPSYLTPEQQMALRQLMGGWPGIDAQATLGHILEFPAAPAS